MHSNSTIYRVLWLITFGSLWIVSFSIVHLSVAHTKLGYQYHLLVSHALHLDEANIQLHSEASALRDLKKAQVFASRNKMTPTDPREVLYLDLNQTQ